MISGMNLAERHLTIEVTNWVLKFANNSCCGPQGSILGPLVFSKSRK